jgi:hypothetical protein
VAGASAASVPPCSSVLPPGAGNQEEPKKPLEAGKQRAKKIERNYGLGVQVAERHVHTTTVGADGDDDAASIPTLEEIQATQAPARPVRRRVRGV